MSNRTITCPPWCTFGGHTRLDPHRASIGTICAPGLTAEMVVRQHELINARVTPPVEVALELDTDAAGRPTGRHTLAIPLPPGTDVEAFLADSDHEPPPATAIVAPGMTFEPYRHRPGRRSEDHRVAQARRTLAESEADISSTNRSYDAPRWHGKLEATVKMLLDVIDEQREQRS